MRYTRHILLSRLALFVFTGTLLVGSGGRSARAQEAKSQEEIRKEIEKEIETAGKGLAEKLSQRIAAMERALKEKDREISDLKKKVEELAGAKPKAVEQKPADKPAAKSAALLGVAHQIPGDEARSKLNLKEGQGAQVSDVHRESPAAKAGIQVGDIIVSLGGKDVGSADLGDLVRARSPGDKVEVVILRGAEKITRTVELADREKFLAATSSEPAKKPEPAAPAKPDPVVLGLLVEETDAGLAVQNVEAGKTGAAAQIKEGDLILALNGKKVKKLEDLTEARDKAKIGEEIAIEYKRKDGVVRATVIAAGEKGEPKFLKI